MNCWIFKLYINEWRIWNRIVWSFNFVYFGLVWFYGIPTILGYSTPNHLYTYVLNIKDLLWFGLVLWHINHSRLFNAKSSLYIYIKYMWFDLVWFLWHINKYWLFNANSLLYIYIYKIYRIWFGFMAYQPLQLI